MSFCISQSGISPWPQTKSPSKLHLVGQKNHGRSILGAAFLLKRGNSAVEIIVKPTIIWWWFADKNFRPPFRPLSRQTDIFLVTVNLPLPIGFTRAASPSCWSNISSSSEHLHSLKTTSQIHAGVLGSIHSSSIFQYSIHSSSIFHLYTFDSSHIP